MIIGRCGVYNKIQCQELHWGSLHWITQWKDVGQGNRDCTLIMSHQNRYTCVLVRVSVCVSVCVCQVFVCLMECMRVFMCVGFVLCVQTHFFDFVCMYFLRLVPTFYKFAFQCAYPCVCVCFKIKKYKVRTKACVRVPQVCPVAGNGTYRIPLPVSS